MERVKGTAGRGLLAGFFAATSLILWFLVIDLIAGEPLRTPRFLATALFAGGRRVAGPGLIGAYTVVHYAVFLVLGVFMAWLARKVRLHVPFLVGVVLGFLLFDLMFYVSIIVTGANVVESLGWPAVLGGSILAGIVLMGTLRMTGVIPGRTIRLLGARHPIVRDGIITGLIGAAALAVWFFIMDLVLRRPFYTPGALGSLVLLGARSAAEVQISVATVLGFTFIHTAVFIVIGIVAAAFFIRAERQPALMLGFVLVFATLAATYIGFIELTASWLATRLGWWALAGGGAAAGIAMYIFLQQRHPIVIERLRQTHTVDRPSDVA